MATNNLTADLAIQVVTNNLKVKNNTISCDHMRCRNCPIGHFDTSIKCEDLVKEAAEITKPLLLTNPELFV